MMKNLSLPVKTLTFAAMAWLGTNQLANVQYTPTPVADTYKVPFAITGKIYKVVIHYNPGQEAVLK